MSLEKMNRKALRHEIYEKLLDYILSGSILPDSRIDEAELAERMGVSRTPLREAINRLTQEQLLREVPYKGNFVRKFTPEEVRDIYEVRKVLEGKTIRLAVENMTDDDITHLTDLYEKIKEEQKKGNIISFSKLDDEFHIYLANCSQNQTLINFIQQLEKQIRLIKVMGNQNNKVANQADSDRHKIMNAIQQRDAVLAEQYMVEHIENACQGVIETMDNQ